MYLGIIDDFFDNITFIPRLLLFKIEHGVYFRLEIYFGYHRELVQFTQSVAFDQQ